MQHESVTHKKEHETKFNELVQTRLKSHRTPTVVSSSSWIPKLVQRIQGGQNRSQSSKRPKQETFTKH